MNGTDANVKLNCLAPRQWKISGHWNNLYIHRFILRQPAYFWLESYELFSKSTRRKKESELCMFFLHTSRSGVCHTMVISKLGEAPLKCAHRVRFVGLHFGTCWLIACCSIFPDSELLNEDNSLIQSYADDCLLALSFFDDKRPQLKNESSEILNFIFNWGSDNFLTLNKTKTYLLYIPIRTNCDIYENFKFKDQICRSRLF